MQDKSIEQAFNEYKIAWMAIPGVVGVGIGETDGRPCIKVYVSQKTPQLAEKIPSSVHGHPVLLVESGEFEPLR